MILVDLETKHTQLYNKLIDYLHENNMSFMDEWDDEAKSLWKSVKQFRHFCETYFDVDSEILEKTLPNA